MIVDKRSVLIRLLTIMLIISITYGCNSNQPQEITYPPSTPEPSHTPEPLWKESNSIDEMTGEKSFFTISPKVDPTHRMSFPYDDVVAWVGVGCSGSDEWVFIGFSTAPNLSNTETEDGYDEITTRIKWDDSIESATFLQDWGDNFLGYYDPQNGDGQMIQNLQNHDTLLLELDWYGEGLVYFNFPLIGVKESIDSMRLKCSDN